jgi:hypothetical protein
MNKGIQYFSEEYLKRCEGATPDQILEFLENYRILLSSTQEISQSISRKRADALRALEGLSDSESVSEDIPS